MMRLPGGGRVPSGGSLLTVALTRRLQARNPVPLRKPTDVPTLESNSSAGRGGDHSGGLLRSPPRRLCIFRRQSKSKERSRHTLEAVALMCAAPRIPGRGGGGTYAQSLLKSVCVCRHSSPPRSAKSSSGASNSPRPKWPCRRRMPRWPRAGGTGRCDSTGVAGQGVVRLRGWGRHVASFRQRGRPAATSHGGVPRLEPQVIPLFRIVVEAGADRGSGSSQGWLVSSGKSVGYPPRLQECDGLRSLDLDWRRNITTVLGGLR